MGWLVIDRPSILDSDDEWEPYRQLTGELDELREEAGGPLTPADVAWTFHQFGCKGDGTIDRLDGVCNARAYQIALWNIDHLMAPHWEDTFDRDQYDHCVQQPDGSWKP